MRNYTARMDTTPGQKRAYTATTETTESMRQVRIHTVGDAVCVVTRVRSKHVRGVQEHRYPLTLLDAAMLAAELNEHVRMAYDRERRRRDGAPTIPPAA